MSAKPAKADNHDAGAAPAKNKTKLFMIIGLVVVLLIGGGGAAFFMMSGKKDAHGDEAAAEEADVQEEKIDPKQLPKFIDLGTFTTNLAYEDGRRIVQAVISLKLSKPEVEEKVKAYAPEISHNILLILQSRSPSSLATTKDKQQLAKQIKEQIDYILGYRKKPPVYVPPSKVAEHNDMAATEESKPKKHSSDEEADSEDQPKKSKKTPIAEVLFTSFLIQ